VRTPTVYGAKRIDGAVPIPLSRLADRARELPHGRPLLVHCAGGYRSSIAASLLQQQGFAQVSELAGGIAAWEAAGLPIAPAAAAGGSGSQAHP
jgi:hydroxyacylglutathione hydrolase